MRTRTRITLAGLVLGIALIGGVAWATIPDGGGVYTACKLTATGTIRLIDPSLPTTSLLQHCTSLETQITWNQKGQKGDAGTNGTNGTNGNDGINGVDGAAGANGEKGDKGDKGDPCPATDPACKGPSGDAGTTGQNAYSSFGTATLDLSSATTSAFLIVPGLSQTVDVPPNSALYISTDGGAQNTLFEGFAGIQVAVFIDGTRELSNGTSILACPKTAGESPVCYWSKAFSTTLPEGAHTIDVRARGEANFLSAASGPRRATLNVLVLKK
jgi:hypothetical protein